MDVTTRRKPMWAPPAMDLRLLNRLPLSLRLITNAPSGKPDLKPEPESESESNLIIIQTPSPPPPKQPQLSVKNPLPHLGRLLVTSLQFILLHRPTSPAPAPAPAPKHEAGCTLPLFRPYVAKLPWHGGLRAFLSRLFPRYGHYCGPNWSSGKDGGSMLWDHRPIDWLDLCCYCHDIGYDTHDQAKLLKADLQFLECLERPRMATKGGIQAALLYRAMCIAGLRYILIPYRTQLVRLQTGPSFGELLENLMGKRKTNNTIIRQA